MNHEQWIVGSHRSVDRLINGKRVAICEVYSGAADSLEQADKFQHLIAAAPDMLIELQLLVATMVMIFGPEKAKHLTVGARDAIAKATKQGPKT